MVSGEGCVAGLCAKSAAAIRATVIRTVNIGGWHLPAKGAWHLSALEPATLFHLRPGFRALFERWLAPFPERSQPPFTFLTSRSGRRAAPGVRRRRLSLRQTRSDSGPSRPD